ncbi:DNA cytosine methyltransferase [Pseudanabaena mucicola]|uniref:Cytosine-specific methyltransferase n=1 Tax=Pseudanabaena mucicola FACHB-723 TaxID=2692860 RepID=A0ABR7ZZE0_9CYAN|nr:DNA cytosine methyltransferase [Pseudanabaena mucicola]MBD2188788.1 DNA cytosine methyltransferase [Pseudanabaena mucicola FACHB-723]
MGNQRPIAVDLFAGAGGMTLGFEQAGFDVLAAVEIDPIHCATHEYNFPMWKVICRSIIDISGDDIRHKSQIGDRKIDVVFGGPPCQGFSLIGKRAIDDPRNELIVHFMRLVLELHPKYFVMENVKGLTIGDHQQVINDVIANFEDNGYQILRPYQVLNASYFGIPQNRERLFLIGCQQELILPKYPSAKTKPAKVKNVPKEFVHLPDSPTVHEAIADLPDLDQYPELIKHDACIVEFAEPKSDYSAYLRGLRTDFHDFSYPRDSDRNLLTSSMATAHSPASIERFRATAHGKLDKVSHFLKLDPHGISNTLRAGTPSTRGGFTAPRPIHPYAPRCITVREAARLHSYPDWFRFHSTKWHGFRQIGNSVPPLLARSVAVQIMQVLGNQISKPEQSISLIDDGGLHLKMLRAAKRYGVSSHLKL